ncbi:MAG: AIR synthase-related protein [Patescibacteria group bacterium]|jgi:phosphoribosylformylglycinamidine (FGAM) synthase-like enzyme
MAEDVLIDIQKKIARTTLLQQHYAVTPPFKTTVPGQRLGTDQQVGVIWLDTIQQTHYYLVVASQAVCPKLTNVQETSWQLAKQVLHEVACARARPISAYHSHVGMAQTWQQAAKGSGILSSYCGVAQQAAWFGFSPLVSERCLVQAGALGLFSIPAQTVIKTEQANIIGTQIIFVGSFAKQTDALLSQHLLAAIATLPNSEQINTRPVGTNGILGTVLQLLQTTVGASAQITCTETAELNTPNLLNAAVTGLILLVPDNLVNTVQQYFQTTWKLADLVSAAQVYNLGVIQAGNQTIMINNKPGAQITTRPSLNMSTGTWLVRTTEPAWEEVQNMEQIAMRFIAHPELAANFAKQQQYDTTVGGHTVLEIKQADAGIIAPLLEQGSSVGIAVSLASNVRQAAISPYWQAVNAVVTSACQIAATGAQPWCLAVDYTQAEQDTLELSWSEQVRGINMAVQALQLPIISQRTGWYAPEKLQTSLNPWPVVVTGFGKINDAANAVTLDFIQPGNTICLIGKRKKELGGSILYTLYNELGKTLPQPELTNIKMQLSFIQNIITERLVPTCHSISRGGLFKTLADMCYGAAGKLRTGIDINLLAIPDTDLTVTQKLFSETSGFVIEVDPRLLPSLQRQAQAQQLTVYPIGQIRADELFILRNGNVTILNIPVGELADSWLRGWPQNVW